MLFSYYKKTIHFHGCSSLWTSTLLPQIWYLGGESHTGIPALGYWCHNNQQPPMSTSHHPFYLNYSYFYSKSQSPNRNRIWKFSTFFNSCLTSETCTKSWVHCTRRFKKIYSNKHLPSKVKNLTRMQEHMKLHQVTLALNSSLISLLLMNLIVPLF